MKFKIKKSRIIVMAASGVAALFAAGAVLGSYLPNVGFYAVMTVACFAVAGLIWYGFTGYDEKKAKNEGKKVKGGTTPENHNQQEDASVANAGKGFKIG